MSMNGLEKITGKILSEANTRAEEILADARAKCADMDAEYAERAQKIKDSLSEDAAKIGMERVSRAKAEAETYQRNLLLQTQSDLIDKVFDGALEWVRRLEPAQYTELLTGLLCAAVLEQVESERVASAYGTEDAVIPANYDVLMNQRDHDKYGSTVVEGAKKKLHGRISEEWLAKLRLDGRSVPMDGGLILRMDDVEINCTLPLLFAQLRAECETDVAQALFEVKGNFGSGAMQK